MNNQGRIWLVIISFILVTLRCDSRATLQGEISCWSFIGVTLHVFKISLN